MLVLASGNCFSVYCKLIFFSLKNCFFQLVETVFCLEGTIFLQKNIILDVERVFCLLETIFIEQLYSSWWKQFTVWWELPFYRISCDQNCNKLNWFFRILGIFLMEQLHLGNWKQCLNLLKTIVIYNQLLLTNGIGFSVQPKTFLVFNKDVRSVQRKPFSCRITSLWVVETVFLSIGKPYLENSFILSSGNGFFFQWIPFFRKSLILVFRSVETIFLQNKLILTS